MVSQTGGFLVLALGPLLRRLHECYGQKASPARWREALSRYSGAESRMLALLRKVICSHNAAGGEVVVLVVVVVPTPAGSPLTRC